jgi:DNA-directed RNA polymerase sigma subunit (sigma70/sigma32)
MSAATSRNPAAYRLTLRRCGPRARPTGPLTAAQQALASGPGSLRLAEAIASRYARRFPRHEADIVSAAFLGLVQAAGRFDPACGALFTTFARPRVLGAVRDALRDLLPVGCRRKGSERPENPFVSLGSPGLSEPSSGDLPVGWEAEAEDEVIRLSRGLPGQYAVAVRTYYLDPRAETFRDLGELLGVGMSRANQLICESHEMLRGGLR